MNIFLFFKKQPRTLLFFYINNNGFMDILQLQNVDRILRKNRIIIKHKTIDELLKKIIKKREVIAA